MLLGRLIRSLIGITLFAAWTACVILSIQFGGLYWFALAGTSLILLCFFFSGTVFALAARLTRSRDDPSAIYCRVCNYDLRGSINRCSECGTPMTRWQVAIASWTTGKHVKPGQEKNDMPSRVTRI